MKKIIKLFIFMFICLVPIVGNAESKLNFEWKLEDNHYITDSDGYYWFVNYNNSVRFTKYDKDGKFIEKKFIPEETKLETVYNDPVLKAYLEESYYDLKYNSKYDKYFLADYYDRSLVVFGEKLGDAVSTISFEEESDLVKEYLGKEFMLYDNLVNAGYEVENIYVDEGYYVTYYGNDTHFFVEIYNNNGNSIFKTEKNGDYDIIAHVNNNNIYVIEEEDTIKVYGLDGELLNTFNISSKLESLYPNDEFYLWDFQVNNNNIMLLYDHEYHVDRSEVSETSKNNRIKDLFDKAKSRQAQFLFLKYRIENDMTLATDKTGGRYTAERKIDEFDREYVELNITTIDGYVVDTIKVVDAYGNEIEVTDNKFYMPGSDVIVSVTYKVGEYLPIPDTGLSQSITIILIGLILISLGAYTINYVRQE